VTDNDGLKDVDIADVTVGPDRTPPDLSKLTVTPGLLWPPDHKPVQVTLEPNASDACGPPTCRILSVVSSDPVTSRSDHTSPDFEITGDLTLWLRSERAGTGTGRVYTITLECTDAAGNSATKSIDVTVPHSASPADTPVPPAPPVVVDLDIAQFRVTNRVSVSRAQSIDITLVVDDTTDPTGPANATVVGVQGGVQVYRETLVVSDSPGRGKTTFEFPGFTPVKAGDIAWTAAINDTDPDVDRAEDTTRVVP
jgi:hypothetical protein